MGIKQRFLILAKMEEQGPHIPTKLNNYKWDKMCETMISHSSQ